MVHLVTGALMGAGGLDRSTAYGLTIGTEIIEALARRRGIQFFEETPANITIDLASTLLTYELTRKS